MAALFQPRATRRCWNIWVLALALGMAACTSVPKTPAPVAAMPPSAQASPASVASLGGAARLPVLPEAGSGRGGYYKDDGPGDLPPEGLLNLPDVVPKIEPYSSSGNKPYAVFGKTYTPLLDLHPFKQRGIGSWYGKKFHGHKTSSGEPYDMYKLTAAHPTLPIPSYARITNLSNQVQIIVRVNDRGPFHSSRIIDLSYAAALKLGYLGKGSSELEVERLLPEDIEHIAGAGQAAQVAAPEKTAASAPPPAFMQAAATAGSAAEEAPAADSVGPASPAFDKLEPASAYYVQLGAFSEIRNAEAVRARLMQTWDSSLPPPEIAYVGVFYRLHSGPFPSRAEAAIAAQKLRATNEIKPMVVQR